MLSMLLSTSAQDIIEDPSLDVNYWPRFLMQAIIVLALCKILGWIFSYLKQPPVIGEIIGGILVGPSVLGQSYWWSVHVFQPTNISAVSSNYFQLVANLGLILFMFALGLELDENLVKRMARTSVPIAIASIVFPFAVGIAFSLWLFDINNDHLSVPVDRVAFMLFTGAAMSFTALPVLASLLTATKLITTPVGIQAISCATIDDVLAWCVLAVSTAFAKGSGINGFYTFLLAVAYILIMLFVMKPLLRALHDYYAKSGDVIASPFTFIMVLFLLGAAFFSEIINIHSFFGSLIAGIVAPKHSEWHRIIAEKIELPTVQIMLPLYFASSGMKTDIGSINTPFLGGVTVAVLVVAVAAKFIPGVLMSKLVTGRDWKFCVSMGILMNTRGLVELIALNIGYQLGILSAPIFTIFVIMAVVTTCMTAPSVYFIYQREYQPELVRQPSMRLDTIRNVTQSQVDEQKGGDTPIANTESPLSGIINDESPTANYELAADHKSNSRNSAHFNGHQPTDSPRRASRSQPSRTLSDHLPSMAIAPMFDERNTSMTHGTDINANA